MSRPLRIAIDCRMLHGPKRGIGHYLDHLVRALAEVDARSRYTLFYVSGRADPSQIVRLPQPNFRTRVLRVPNPLFNRIFDDGSAAYRCARAVSRSFDIVHEPGFSPLPLAPRLVLTLHDLISFRSADHFPPDLAAAAQRRLRLSARTATQIMADSEHTRRDALELLGLAPEKIHTVPLGVDAAELETGMDEAEAARELETLGVTKPFFLTLGDLLRGKNNITALRGFIGLAREMRETHQMVIAGTPGPDAVMRELGEAVAGAGMKKTVLMPGYVGSGARRALMSRAAALLFPSVYEGFGLPPLEAMASGTPVIAADNTSIPEVVGDAGILVADYLEPAAWTGAMTRLLTDAALKDDLIRRGRQRARLFTWERTARETRRIYELAAQS